MTSYLTFINIEKNLGDERFDLVKHVVLLVYGDNCVMTCESDQALWRELWRQQVLAQCSLRFLRLSIRQLLLDFDHRG